MLLKLVGLIVLGVYMVWPKMKRAKASGAIGFTTGLMRFSIFLVGLALTGLGLVLVLEKLMP